jgi:hypothetical protein
MEFDTYWKNPKNPYERNSARAESNKKKSINNIEDLGFLAKRDA